jgi:CheY-like chemotaxis protein
MINSSTINRNMEVLLVEDNLGDVELTTLALEESSLSINLSVVGDGAAAMDFLHHQKYINAPHPDLILIDLISNQLLTMMRTSKIVSGCQL